MFVFLLTADELFEVDEVDHVSIADLLSFGGSQRLILLVQFFNEGEVSVSESYQHNGQRE